MTSTPKDSHKKAHAISIGLLQYIADFRLATFADVAGHDALEMHTKQWIIKLSHLSR